MQPFQLTHLMKHARVRRHIEVLTADAYRADVERVNAHFQFAVNQQIDWSGASDVVWGRIDDLSARELQALLARFGVPPGRRVHVLWAYGDFGVTLPLREVAAHLDDIWFPVTDDVFVFDPADAWCLELHHEGEYSCGRYEPAQR